ncbi:MAG: hypothetical protein KBD53_11835 [Candidatus Omnitrophica bacterium]|nr:hypothetical protein [Candidatus Omnitrophota bacterium]
MADIAENTAVADALKNFLESTLKAKCNLEFSSPAQLSEREIIEYNSRIRVDGLEKFNGPCYVFGMNYYSSEANQKKDEAAGTLIMFIEEECVERFLKSLGHRGFDEDDQTFVLDKLGEFCKTMAQEFSQNLQSLGYSGLIVSDVSKGKNNLADGLSFPYDRYNYQEIAISIWKKKAMVADIIMTASK